MTISGAGPRRAGLVPSAAAVPGVSVLAVPGVSVLAVLGVSVLAVLLAGCSAGPAPGTAGTSCGHMRTAVNVPVVIMVARGTVDCATAMRVEAAYAAAIKAGDLRGNGGGAPVTVDGWTCESYPTQEVLRTGNASECHTASTEVVAVLSLPTVSASGSGSG